MSDDIFGFEVGSAGTGENIFVRILAKIHSRYRFRFRISEAPGLTRAEPWGAPCKLRIPDPRISYLLFEFPSPENLRQIGEEIAAVIFQGQIIRLFTWSLARAGARNKTLRVMFSYHNDAGFAARRLPWESIFYQLTKGYAEHFGLSTALGVARFFPPHHDTYTPFKVDDKLRVLAVAANPKRCATELGVDAELTAISELAQFLDEEIEFQPMMNTRWENFVPQLVAFNPHVLFFTGHGGFVRDEPHLFFQNPDASCQPISIAKLAATLRPIPSLKLVILSACQTAASRNPFVSGAEQLVRDIPAVIAMQSKVDELAAREFAMRFFTYLFQQDYPIDTCVNAGRQAMQDFRRTRTEWAVPVLFLATRNDIFDFRPSSNINSEESKKRAAMEEKFPLPVEPFIPRQTLIEQFEAHFRGGPRLTVVSGPPGAGKTQITSKFCIEKIRTRGQRDKTRAGNELFFYVRCKKEWTSFVDVLVELDLQTRSLGFKGFNEIIKDPARSGADKSIQMFSELLAQHDIVIVLDDYVWDGPAFWNELFLQLANHLRSSKVFVLTSQQKLVGLGQQSHIKVEGFLPTAEFEPTEMELEVMRQLSVLRRPVTLNELALMLAPQEPSRYLEAAKSVQARSLLTFTRNLGVELSKEQQVSVRNEMNKQDRNRFHQQAAIFYEGRANEISKAEELFHEAESRKNQ